MCGKRKRNFEPWGSTKKQKTSFRVAKDRIEKSVLWCHINERVRECVLFEILSFYENREEVRRRSSPKNVDILLQYFLGDIPLVVLASRKISYDVDPVETCLKVLESLITTELNCEVKKNKKLHLIMCEIYNRNWKI